MPAAYQHRMDKVLEFKILLGTTDADQFLVVSDAHVFLFFWEQLPTLKRTRSEVSGHSNVLVDSRSLVATCGELGHNQPPQKLKKKRNSHQRHGDIPWSFMRFILQLLPRRSRSYGVLRFQGFLRAQRYTHRPCALIVCCNVAGYPTIKGIIPNSAGIRIKF